MNTIHDNSATKQQAAPVFTKDQILTVNEFIELKAQLLYEVRQLVNEVTGKPTKQWLKSQEVIKLLGISPTTLQTLRNNGTIPFTKVGGVVFYSSSEIQQMLEKKKVRAV